MIHSKGEVSYDPDYLREALMRHNIKPLYFARFSNKELSKDILSRVLLGKYQPRQFTGKIQLIVKHLKRLGAVDAENFITPPEKRLNLNQEEVNPIMTNDILKHFGFNEEPFQAGITSRLWFNRENKEIVETAINEVMAAKMVAFIGSVGAGKSSISKYIIEQLEENTKIRIAKIPKMIIREADSIHIVEAVLNQICQITNIPFRRMERNDSMIRTMLEIGKLGIKPVIFIDDAHLLSNDAWKDIKMLWEDYKESDAPISILAFAQPLLNSTLTRDSLREVYERIQTYTMKSFSTRNIEEITDYIRFKLELAGSKEKLFADEAIKEIAKRCDTPLRVNLVCRQALKQAYEIGRTKVDQEILYSILPRR
jgi:type II secretory pathway predicted ATPase ExeA